MHILSEMSLLDNNDPIESWRKKNKNKTKFHISSKNHKIQRRVEEGWRTLAGMHQKYITMEV